MNTSHIRWLRRAFLLFAFGLTLASAAPNAAQAQCAPLKTHVDWMKNKPNGAGDYRLRVTLASNIGAGVVRYARGELALNNAGTLLFGNLEMVRNVDTWVDPVSPSEEYPFSPYDAQNTYMEMNATTGTFTFGSDKIPSVECSWFMVRGSSKPTGFALFANYYVLSFSQVYRLPNIVN